MSIWDLYVFVVSIAELRSFPQSHFLTKLGEDFNLLFTLAESNTDGCGPVPIVPEGMSVYWVLIDPMSTPDLPGRVLIASE